MSILIDPNTSITINASFLNYDTQFGYEEPILVDAISGMIYLWDDDTENFETVGPFTPVEDSIGFYSFTWTPDEPGKYQIIFEATIGPTIAQSVKYFFVGDITPDNTIGPIEPMTFLGVLDPLFVDPEKVLTYYADADLVEVTELIHWYSKEVLFIKKRKWIDPITPLIHDFVLASVLCDLSRIYIFDGGLAGFASADSFSLADLKVSKSTGASTAKSVNQYNRGSALTWCELAALLRQQLISGEANIKAVVKGGNYENPIPNRKLRRFE